MWNPKDFAVGLLLAGKFCQNIFEVHVYERGDLNHV